MTYSRFTVIGLCLYVCFFVSSLTGSLTAFVLSGICAAGFFAVRFTVNNKNAVLALTAAAASFLIYGIYSAAFVEPTAGLAGNTYELTAKVISVTPASRGAEYVTAEGSADGVPVRFSFYYPYNDIVAGDAADVRVSFSEFPRTASQNDNYNYSRGIFLRAYSEGAAVLEKGGFSINSAISAYSSYLREIIAGELSGDEGSLLLAVFFGDKSGLTGEFSAAVRKAGLSHMTAVSGMHFSLIVIIVMSLLRLLPPGRNRFVRFGTVLLLTAFFSVFFNMTASVRRSGIMMVICFAGELFARKRSVLSSLGAAVTLILLCEPCACRDAGLLMSVCGTFGAGVVSPSVCALISRHRKLSVTAVSAITSVCATYCTIPAVTLIFGGFSVLSPVTTVIVYPFFITAMAFTLLFALTGGFAGGVLLIPAGAAMKPVSELIKAVSGFRYGYIVPDSEQFPVFMAVSAVFILAVALLVRFKKLRGRHLLYACAGAFCALAGLITADRLSDRGNARITVYSDGSDFLAALEYRSGVSLFASGVSEKLSDKAYEMMCDMCVDRFDLICVMTEKERSMVYAPAFAELPALERRFMENSEFICDIGGLYEVTVYEDAAETEINGVGMIFSDVAAAPIYEGHGIAVYGGYKRSERYDINSVTVLADKRYGDPDNAYSAYVYDTEVRIDREGRIRVLQK
mgnify:CR=1 FL=1